MQREYVQDLPGPHWDAEWDCLRGNIRYWLTLPTGGIDHKTGFIVLLHGYGESGDSEYAGKFRAFMSDKYNCCVVTLNYYGSSSYSNVGFKPASDFFLKLKEHHGVSIRQTGSLDIMQVVRATMSACNERGIVRLHKECVLELETDEYHSFGLLPAIDALTVVNDVLQKFSLDKKRLFAIGTSYGGFIVQMMLKLAPNTFRMLVDNSGFTRVEEDTAGLYGWGSTKISGVRIMVSMSVRWSQDPTSPYYFSEDCRDVRNLLKSDHMVNSETRLYSYHSSNDALIPAVNKQALLDVYRGKVPYEQTIVEEKNIDGHLFKSLEHGMQASLRGLFELSYEKYLSAPNDANGATDFELKSKILLPCTDRTYIAYYDDAGVELVID